MRLDHLLLGRKDRLSLKSLSIPSRNGNQLISFLFIFNTNMLPEKKGSIYFRKAKESGFAKVMGV